MKRLFAVAAGLCVFFATSCINLNPSRITMDPPACNLLGIAVGDETLATVCDDMVDVVGAIIARTLPPAGPIAQSASSDEQQFKFISVDGRVVGLVRADLAPVVQAELDE